MHGKPSDDRLGLETFSDLLRRRAEQFPERVAFVYEDETGQVEQWTYAELDRRASAIAAWLAQRTEVGDRALLVYPSGLDFIAAFLGCLVAGVLPVPATYPKPRRPSQRLDTIASDCEPKLVLTHSSVLGGLCLDEQSEAVAGLTWEATDRLPALASEKQTYVERAGEDLAFLQYTSGSTSEPRGVMISHANLLHNLETIRQGFAIEPAGKGEPVRGVFWLPAHHDMGLVGGILTPLYAGGTSFLLAPTTFLRRPLRWLQLLSETRAGISGAPNFGYDLVLQKTTAEQRASLDLSHWRLAFCGAEPINAGTLQDFAVAFEPAGFRSNAFYPCYGMAEATLLVSGGFVSDDRGSGAMEILTVDREQLRQNQAVVVESSRKDAQPLVSCGGTLNRHEVAIVEPKTRMRCPEGRVGEIWVRGGSVARGYWNQDAANRKTFEATLREESEKKYLRTGDLGFCHEGELYVTGRLKDLIIIRGRNHYPQDIEHTATKGQPAVDLGAAFGVEGEREEQLVVVLQVRREHRKADLDAVLREVRTAVVDEHELEPQTIVLIRPVSLPITSSGKVQRRRCREQYLNGELNVLAQWVAEPIVSHVDEVARPEFLSELLEADSLQAKVEAWLIAWLARRANLNAGVLQPTTPFVELGIDSLSAVEISQELDQVLELELPPMVIWSFPTCEALAVYLTEELIADRKGKG